MKGFASCSRVACLLAESCLQKPWKRGNVEKKLTSYVIGELLHKQQCDIVMPLCAPVSPTLEAPIASSTNWAALGLEVKFSLVPSPTGSFCSGHAKGGLWVMKPFYSFLLTNFPNVFKKFLYAVSSRP